MKKLLGLLMIAFLGGMLSLIAYKSYFEKEVQIQYVESQPLKYVSHPAAMPLPGGDVDFRAAAAMTVNAVVHVKTQYVVGENINPWSDLFGRTPQSILQAAGSGVIISDEGYIITNNHVIENASQIEVTLNDNKTLKAKLIGSDPSTDLALIKIEAEDLPFVKFGNSDQLQVGEWVLAVGNPFSLTSTVTAGIVSAKARNINLLEVDPNREIFPVESFIQTDAAVNPGNSGGALVNTRGELVGINTAIASRTGTYAGYSFAVPSSIVQKVARDLIDFGEVQRAFIGVSISDLNQEIADRLGVKDVNGVLVQGLTPGGAAEKVGIKEGDIILQVEGQNVRNVPELQERVSTYRPGESISVKINRDNKIIDIPLTLRNKEGNVSLSQPNQVVNDRSVETLIQGALMEPLNQNELGDLHIENGVKIITDKTGKFRQAGIRDGFIITKIDKQKVSKPKQVDALLSSLEGGVLIEGIYPDGRKAFYGFGL